MTQEIIETINKLHFQLDHLLVISCFKTKEEAETFRFRLIEFANS